MTQLFIIFRNSTYRQMCPMHQLLGYQLQGMIRIQVEFKKPALKVSSANISDSQTKPE